MLAVAKNGEVGAQYFGIMLSLAEGLFMATFDVLSMRSQYFRYIIEQEMDSSRQMHFLVDQKQYSAF